MILSRSDSPARKEGTMKPIYYKGCDIIQHYGYVQIRFPNGTGWNADTVQEARKEIDQYENEYIKYRGYDIRIDYDGFSAYDPIYDEIMCYDTLDEAKEDIDKLLREGVDL